MRLHLWVKSYHQYGLTPWIATGCWIREIFQYSEIWCVKKLGDDGEPKTYKKCMWIIIWTCTYILNSDKIPWELKVCWRRQWFIVLENRKNTQHQKWRNECRTENHKILIWNMTSRGKSKYFSPSKLAAYILLMLSCYWIGKANDRAIFFL